MNFKYRIYKMVVRNDFTTSLLAVKHLFLGKDKKGIDEAISIYSPDRINDIKLRYSLIFNRMRFSVAYFEYFLLDFEYLNAKGKRRYIGDKERLDIFKKITKEENKAIFDNKELTYSVFRKYYHREVIKICGEADREKFYEFADRHSNIIVKPLDASFGKGVFSVDFINESVSKERVFETMRDGEYVIEEKIIQAGEMAKFHPQSCNTIRYTTFFTGEKVVPMFSYMRMGVGSSVVDNGGAGGIICLIDIETGVIKNAGLQENGKRYLFHPDTGEQIIGFNIPRWDEAKKLAEELAMVVKSQRYVGWDLALTDDGWVVVEGNYRGQFGAQWCEKVGCRKQIEELFTERNLAK